MLIDELNELLGAVAQSAFRLETLAEYDAPSEVDVLNDYLAGRPLPPRNTETVPWLRMMGSSVAAGRVWRRVHLVAEPLTDYLRFELGYQYPGNVAAGEDIRIAFRGVSPELDEAGDFWLLDDEVAYVMTYSANGKLISADAAADVAPYRHLRDLALAHSIPLAEYRTW